MCIIPYLINMIGLHVYMNNYHVSMIFSNEERGGGGGGGYTINSKKIVNMKQL